MYRKIKAIISGGGTGGHIYPAISIAEALMSLNPDNEILFVGAEGKMEMEKVPAAGFKIVGLPVVGLQRQLNWANIKNDVQIPFKVAASLRKAGKILDEFKPDIVIGVGGYASAPLLWKATAKHIPAIIQEQNSFAGLTNRILSRRVGRICVAYEGMDRFFPKDKIVFTGNPIRTTMKPVSAEMREEGISLYGFTPGRKHLLVVGGSLGCGTLNHTMKGWIEAGCPGGEGVEILWQCGKGYKAGIDAFMEGRNLPGVRHTDFITRPDLAYAAADVVVSRSGASSISELCALGKACIFVPSPNVAEDHQTHNAMALVNKGAALLVRDADAATQLMNTAFALLDEPEKIAEMERNSAALGKLTAATDIACQAYSLIG